MEMRLIVRVGIYLQGNGESSEAAFAETLVWIGTYNLRSPGCGFDMTGYK